MNKIETYLLTKKANGAAPQSIKAAEFGLNHFVKTGGEFTKIGITTWIAQQLDNGLKPVTLNHYLRTIRAFCYWVFEEYDEPKFKIKLVKEPEIQPKCFKESDLKKLLVKPSKSASWSEWRMWTIVNFILATGCRARTLVNIKVSDIRDDKVIFRETKNKKVQVLPLSPSILLALAKWYPKCIENEYLFSTIHGKQLSSTGLQGAFKRYCLSRDVHQHNIHGLRHSFASIAVKNGMSVFELQKWLGHSDISITQNYVHLFTSDLSENIYKNPLETIRK